MSLDKPKLDVSTASEVAITYLDVAIAQKKKFHFVQNSIYFTSKYCNRMQNKM